MQRLSRAKILARHGSRRAPASQSAMNENADARIRILFVITSTAGGAGLHLLQLCQRLPRDRFAITVAFGPGYPLDPEFDRLELPILRLNLSRELSIGRMISSFIQIYRELRHGNYDILCSSCSLAGVVGRLAGFAAGVSLRVHILQVYASHPHQSAIRQRLYRVVERMLDPLTTAYMAVSEATRRFGVAHAIISDEKVHVVHNGIELFDPRQIVSTIRADLGWANHPVVCFAGRFEEQKGLRYFLEAAALVRDTRPDARFMVVGDGPLRAEADALVHRLGLGPVVRFLGWRTDSCNVLAASDIFCLSSLWEQLPLVLLEAMMLGKAIVATAVDGVPEAAIHRETALLVPPADARALADALLLLLNDQAQARSLGQRAAAKVLAMFTVERMIEHYERLFLQLTGRSAVPAGERARTYG